MQIIPAILEKEFANAEAKISRVKNLVKWIQIDVIDGIFTYGKTFELELLNKKIKETENILWDIHLMVKEPKNWIEKCNFVGATRIIGQVENMSDRVEFINKVKDLGLEAGLAFDIDTNIAEIPLETDLVLLMGRKLGFDSKPIDKKIFERIEKVKKIREIENKNFLIGVDGGINKENIEELKRSGVDIAYCTGAIFNGNVDNNLKELIYVGEN